MVAIRNRNTPVPHVFRYPKWEEGIFYPAGSLVSYPVQDLQLYDSDIVFYEFFVSKFDIDAGGQPPTEDSVVWKFIMSTAQPLDSEIELRLRALDSDITANEERITRLIDFDSDIAYKVDSEIRNRLENDSELYRYIDSEITREISKRLESDSDITVRIDSIDSDLTNLEVAHISNVAALDPRGGDVLSWDSDLRTWKAVSMSDAQALAGGNAYDYGTF